MGGRGGREKRRRGRKRKDRNRPLSVGKRWMELAGKGKEKQQKDACASSTQLAEVWFFEENSSLPTPRCLISLLLGQLRLEGSDFEL